MHTNRATQERAPSELSLPMAEEPEPDLGAAEDAVEPAVEMPGWKSPEDTDPQVGVFQGPQRLLLGYFIVSLKSPIELSKKCYFRACINPAGDAFVYHHHSPRPPLVRVMPPLPV